MRTTETKPPKQNHTTAGPEPEWIRGTCPECGAPVISDLRYVGGKGYLLVWICWEAQGANPTCTYRRVL